MPWGGRYGLASRGQRGYRRRMSRVACDVVVIGGELCGLAAAALIANQSGRSARVVVLDDGDAVTAMPLGDRFVPTVPTLLRLPTSGPVGALLDSLQLKQDARRVLGEPGGLGVIDDPDVRMVVPVEGESRAKELARVFGADEGARTAARLHDVNADARAGLYAEAGLIHEDGFFEKRRQKRRLEALAAMGRTEDDDPAALALAAVSLGVAGEQLLPFVQHASTGSARGFGGLLAALQLQAGAHGSSKGGLGPRAALGEMLAEIVRRHRGEIFKAKIEAVEADGKTITAVKATGANDYVARVVIDATSARDIATRLPEGRRRDKLLEAEGHVVHGGDAVSVRWLVPAAALPRGLPPLALVLRPPPASGVLVGVYAGAPLREGHKNVGVDDSLVAVVGAAVCATGEAESAAAGVEAALDQLLPFAKEQTRAREVLAGGAARAALAPWKVVDSEHGLGGRRPQTPYANLLRAGRDLVPALGPEGELMAARAVAAAAEEMLGANKRGEAA